MKTIILKFSKTRFIALLLFSFTTATLQAQYTLTDDDVTVENGIITASLLSVTGNIIIPDTLDGQMVIGIGISNGYGVFNDRKLTGVVLPESLLQIGDYAFIRNNLTNLAIPNNVKNIGYATFGHNNLTSLFIPKSVTAIDEGAFSDNKLLDIVFEENSSIRILLNSFVFNPEEAKLTFPTNSNEGFKGYIDVRDILFSPGSVTNEIQGNTFYAVIPVRTLTADDVKLVEGEIVESAIYKDIIIPDTINGELITSIGVDAFKKHFLKSIIIPESVRQIKKRAFKGNEIKSLTIPNTISIIEEDVFSYNDLDTIYLPNSITTIGDRAFAGNYWSKSVDLSKSLTFIGVEAFAYHRFNQVLLPNCIKSIGKGAFIPNANSSLKTIALPHPVINEGYVFTHWLDGKDSIVTEMNDLETSFTAQFSPTQSCQVSGTVVTDETSGLLLLLSGDFDGVRAVSDSGIFQFPLNAGRTITVTPNREGYLFFPESITLSNIQTDKTDLYFTGSINDYNITFVAGENGTLSGETFQNRAYKQKTSPVTAMPNSGYKLAAWKDQKGTVISTDNTIVIEVRKDMEVTAIFESLVGFKAVNKINLQCYPNPVTNNLTVVAPQNILKIELYNTLGERVFIQENINKNTVTLNAAQYIKGVYFVHVNGKGFTEVVKVVVE